MSTKPKSTAPPAPEVISDREAARLAKHFLALDEKRLEHGRAIGLITKEQEAIKARVAEFVVDRAPKDRVVRLAKAILRVTTEASCRFISWKTVCTEWLGAAVVAEIEANPPARDVVRIEHNVGGERSEAGGRRPEAGGKKVA